MKGEFLTLALMSLLLAFSFVYGGGESESPTHSAASPSSDPTGGSSGASGSAHGPNWGYNWGWGSTPEGGYGYGSGSGSTPDGKGKGTGFGFGSGSGSGTGFGFGSGGGGATGGGSGHGSGTGHASEGGGAGGGNGGASPGLEELREVDSRLVEGRVLQEEHQTVRRHSEVAEEQWSTKEQQNRGCHDSEVADLSFTMEESQSPTEPLEIPAGQPRATEDNAPGDNIPSPVARASDGGKTSAPGETQTAVLEISDSSSADREGEQDEEVDKDQIEEMGEDDGVEEADEDQDEEKGDEPSEGSSEARNDETTPQVEDEGTDPPGLSADGVNVEQEQVGRVDEQVKDSEEAGTNSGE
ncbi:hypothetical protein Bca52824_038001 [Brassica carinata]|uniref:Uncharacterized protein n=1 Tax=Brassica carinata TaxID=52824 RepID=A0A8X7UUH4_BRACI|nr:hypothetical protein Bca52824_038001 [Brassica carinata]